MSDRTDFDDQAQPINEQDPAAPAEGETAPHEPVVREGETLGPLARFADGAAQRREGPGERPPRRYEGNRDQARSRYPREGDAGRRDYRERGADSRTADRRSYSDRSPASRGDYEGRRPYYREGADSRYGREREPRRPYESRPQEYSRDNRPQYNRDERRPYSREDRPQFNRDERPPYRREERPQYSREERPRSFEGRQPRYSEREYGEWQRPQEYYSQRPPRNSQRQRDERDEARTSVRADVAGPRLRTPEKYTAEQLAHTVELIHAACLEVHRELGSALEAVTYQRALALELQAREIPFEREARAPVAYRQRQIDARRVDFVIDGCIVELRSEPEVSRFQLARSLSYLKASRYQVALVINFGGEKPEVHTLQA